MKFIKYLITILALVVLPVFASMTTIDTTGLTKDQINELQIQALKAQQGKADSKSTIDTIANVSSVTRSEAEKWSDLGKNLGSALVATAKELGVAAVDFSKTDLGKIVTFIIVYKLIGSSVLHVIAGLIILVTIPTLIIFARRYLTTKEIVYEITPFVIFGIPFKKKTVKSITKINDVDTFWIFFWTSLLTIASVVGAIIVMLVGV